MSTHDESIAKRRVSARDRLLSMPEVFTLAELALVMGVSLPTASQYVWRWKLAELVLPLGGNSGVFLNRVRNPSAPADGSLWERALLKAMPSAIIAGHEVLADEGYTTQVTHQRYVIVSPTESTCEIAGAEVRPRPLVWLKRLARRGALVQSEEAQEARLAPRLAAGAALADLQAFDEGSFHEDDIDWDAIDDENLALYRELITGIGRQPYGQARPAPDSRRQRQGSAGG